MLNLDNIVSNKNENKDNNWPFRMLIIGPSGSGKTNTLFHLIQNLNVTTPVDKIYLYAKDLTEPKYEFLLNNRKMLELNILTIQLHLLSIQMTWVMFLLILTIIIKKEKEKY